LTILEKIAASKTKEIEARKKDRPLSKLQEALKETDAPRDFKGSLQKGSIQLIGEIKKISPIQGVLRDPFDPVDLAQQYAQSGAASLSILTDGPFFGGDLTFLRSVRQAVNLPLLRKDFVLDPYQVYESRVAGADAALLIAALLDFRSLTSMITLSKELGLACLVEVHTDEELECVLKTDAEIIGINNRNLKTFEVDLKTSETLIQKIPQGKVTVSESGIHSHEEVKRLASLGFHAVLIGQTFMQQPDLKRAVHEVMGR